MQKTTPERPKYMPETKKKDEALGWSAIIFVAAIIGLCGTLIGRCSISHTECIRICDQRSIKSYSWNRCECSDEYPVVDGC